MRSQLVASCADLHKEWDLGYHAGPDRVAMWSEMDVTLRRATEADVPDLARLLIVAAHGIIDALYHDLVPGVPTEKLFEWRFTQIGSVRSYEHCWVAQQGARTIGMDRKS